MLRSAQLLVLRRLAPLALVVPFACLAACGDDAELSGTSKDAGGGGGNEGGSGKDGGMTPNDGSTGNDGASGNDGAVTPDKTPPKVVSTFPATGSMTESTTTVVTVTFDETMDPNSLMGAMTVTQGGATVLGTVLPFDNTVSFTPTADLALNTPYVVTVTTAAKDLAGNALAMIHTFNFKTDAAAPNGPAPVLLGAAGKYVVLAESTVTNDPTSKITGDLGLSPAAATFFTGFSMTKAGTYWTSAQVTGKLFAADNDPPTPNNLTVAVGAMHAAYTDAAGRPTPDFLNYDANTLGGTPLVPGLYNWDAAVTIPNDVTISGGANDVWIFQVAGNVSIAAGKKMLMANGARPKNVFWQVSGLVDVGVGSHVEGIFLSKTLIKFGANSSANGRLFAQTAVNLEKVTLKP